MLKKLIIFLIRKRLGLKKGETFQFVGQKTNAEYWFESDFLAKYYENQYSESGVSLNWLLNDHCEIRKI